MGGEYAPHYGLRGPAFEPDAMDYPSHLRIDEIEPYLVERLRAVDWQGHPMLHPGLAPLLHEATAGERSAIDRAMTALLEEAAGEGSTIVDGDKLAAWLDDEPEGTEAPVPTAGLAEAQIGAIEVAFADHDRKLTQLRRELADLRDLASVSTLPDRVEIRLETIETRLDQQEAALRHVLKQLIAFFERDAGRSPSA